MPILASLVIEILLFTIVALQQKRENLERLQREVAVFQTLWPHDHKPVSRTIGVIVKGRWFDYLLQMFYLSPILVVFFHSEFRVNLLWFTAASIVIEFMVRVGSRYITVRFVLPRLIALAKWSGGYLIKSPGQMETADRVASTLPGKIVIFEEFLELERSRDYNRFQKLLFIAASTTHLTATLLWFSERIDSAVYIVALVPAAFVLLCGILSAVFKTDLQMSPAQGVDKNI